MHAANLTTLTASNWVKYLSSRRPATGMRGPMWGGLNAVQALTIRSKISYGVPALMHLGLVIGTRISVPLLSTFYAGHGAYFFLYGDVLISCTRSEASLMKDGNYFCLCARLFTISCRKNLIQSGWYVYVAIICAAKISKVGRFEPWSCLQFGPCCVAPRVLRRVILRSP